MYIPFHFLCFYFTNSRNSLSSTLYPTGKWNPPVPSSIKHWIVQRTPGYCGADIQAFCSEATIIGFRRAYPQIYEHSFRLSLPNKQIALSAGDFEAALCKIVPASRRSLKRSAQALDAELRPRLGHFYCAALSLLALEFPAARDSLLRQLREEKRFLNELKTSAAASSSTSTVKKVVSEGTRDDVSRKSLFSDSINGFNDNVSSSSDSSGGGTSSMSADLIASYEAIANGDVETWTAGMADARAALGGPLNTSYHPRLLLHGPPGAGQTELSQAILSCMEGMPYVSLEHSILLGDAVAQSPEHALVQRLQEAVASAPSVVYFPDVSTWWKAASPSLRAALTAARRAIPSNAQILWIATASIDDCQPLVDQWVSELHGSATLGQSEVDPVVASMSLSANKHEHDHSITDFLDPEIDAMGFGDLLLWLSNEKIPLEDVPQTHIVSNDGFGNYQLQPVRCVGGVKKDFTWQGLGKRALNLVLPTTSQTDMFFAPFFKDITTLPQRVLSVRRSILQARTQVFELEGDKEKESVSSAGIGHGLEEICSPKRMTRSTVASSSAEVNKYNPSSSAPNNGKKRSRAQLASDKNYKGQPFDGHLRHYPPYGDHSAAYDEAADERDSNHLRELRIFCRNALAELVKDKRHQRFARPVDPETVPDYYDVVQCPMDLETMRAKVDDALYPSLPHFLRDLEQIVYNAKEYNPCTIKDVRGRQIVALAAGMEDIVKSYAYTFKRNIGYDLFKRCDEVVRRRQIPLPVAPVKNGNMDELQTAANVANAVYYQDILQIHEELKVEYGDDHPTVVKEREHIEAAEETARKKEERKAVKLAKLEAKKKRRSTRADGEEGKEEDEEEEEEDDDEGGNMSRLLSLPSSASHYLEVAAGLALPIDDTDPEAYWKQIRRAEAKQRRESAQLARDLVKKEKEERGEGKGEGGEQEAETEGKNKQGEGEEDETKAECVVSYEVTSYIDSMDTDVPSPVQTQTHSTSEHEVVSETSAMVTVESTAAPSNSSSSSSSSSSSGATSKVIPPPLSEDEINELPSMRLLAFAALQALGQGTADEIARLKSQILIQYSQSSVSHHSGALARMQREVTAFEQGHGALPYDWSSLLSALKNALLS